MRQVELVVVGAGPGGCAAAVQAARLGVRPLLLDRAGRAGGLIENARQVENYPGLEGPVGGPLFAVRLREHLSRFGLEVEQGALEAISPAPSPGRFLLRGSFGELEAGAVVLAPGTHPRPLGLPGEEALFGKGLFYEVKHLLPRPPARVIVVGGGEAAFDYSLSLAGAGARVSLCIRSERPAARGRLVEQVSAEERIELLTSTQAVGAAADGEGVGLRVLSPQGPRTLSAGAVLVAVGRTSAAAPLQLPEPAQRGLFLIGDARLGALGQAGIAVGEGLLAAAQAVGHLEGSRSAGGQ